MRQHRSSPCSVILKAAYAGGRILDWSSHHQSLLVAELETVDVKMEGAYYRRVSRYLHDIRRVGVLYGSHAASSR